MGALLDLWICCFSGFRESVVVSSRDCGFASMCLCGFTELCVSGLAGSRWRDVHRAAGASRPCGLSSLTPSPLRCCALCLPPGDRPAAHPRRAALGAPRIPPNRLAGSAGRAVSPMNDLFCGRGWLAVSFTVSRRSRRQGLRVRCTLASWRPSANLDGCAAPCCFRSRAIPP